MLIMEKSHIRFKCLNLEFPIRTFGVWMQPEVCNVSIDSVKVCGSINSSCWKLAVREYIWQSLIKTWRDLQLPVIIQINASVVVRPENVDWVVAFGNAAQRHCVVSLG